MTSQINGNPSIPFTVASSAIVAGTELLLFGHVLDCIKTYQQAHIKTPISIYRAAKSIYDLKGARGFYRGFRWNAVTHCGKAGFRWTTMSMMDRFMTQVIPENTQQNHPLLKIVSLGVIASLSESLLLVCPAESFKIKEMTIDKTVPDFKVVAFMKQSGFRRMFDGWDSILIRQWVSWTSFLIAYEKVDQLAHHLTQKKRLNLIEQFSVGALAGAINVVFTTPIDTVKTQMQKCDRIESRNAIAAFKVLYQNHGLSGLYASLPIRMVRSSWYAGITLLMMEKLGIFRTHQA